MYGIVVMDNIDQLSNIEKYYPSLNSKARFISESVGLTVASECIN